MTIFKSQLIEIKKKQIFVLSNAVKVILKLKVESVIDRYLRGEITRDEAIKLIGAKMVEIADKQLKAVLDDVKWGINE